MENETMKLTEKELADCNKAYKSDPIDEGVFLKYSKAKKYLDDFLNEDAQPTTSDEIYGFTFGLKKIKDLMGKIERHNDDENNIPIHGLKFYYAKSVRKNNPKKNRDLIVVPTNINNDDLWPIHVRHLKESDLKLSTEQLNGDDEIVLCESRPCPNQCENK